MATVGFFRIYRYRLSFKSLVSILIIHKIMLTCIQHGNLKAPPFSMWFGTIPGMCNDSHNQAQSYLSYLPALVFLGKSYF